MVRMTYHPKYLRGPLPVEHTLIIYEEVIVGEEMGPVFYDIKESTHKKHADLFGFHQDWFMKEKVLFPWEIWSGVRTMSRWKYGRINAAINAEMHYWFLKPARVNEPLAGSVIVLDKYTKRGKKYVSFEESTRNESGELVFRNRHEMILASKVTEKVPHSTITEQRQHEKGWWNEAKPGKVPPATKDIPEGFILPMISRPPMPFRISGWEEGGWSKNEWVNNIHEDDFAKARGYKGGLVEANIVGEHVFLNLLCDFFGADRLYNGGKWDMKMTGPVYMGDKLVAKARVSQKIPQDEKTIRVTLELRAENQDGKLVQLGTASAFVG